MQSGITRYSLPPRQPQQSQDIIFGGETTKNFAIRIQHAYSTCHDMFDNLKRLDLKELPDEETWIPEDYAYFYNRLLTLEPYLDTLLKYAPKIIASDDAELSDVATVADALIAFMRMLEQYRDTVLLYYMKVPKEAGLHQKVTALKEFKQVALFHARIEEFFCLGPARWDEIIKKLKALSKQGAKRIHVRPSPQDPDLYALDSRLIMHREGSTFSNQRLPAKDPDSVKVSG